MNVFDKSANILNGNTILYDKRQAIKKNANYKNMNTLYNKCELMR